jgi:transcriptional regulator with XRE-family HTH domain
MTNLRHLLTYNIKENRKKLGFSQAKLAEKAGLSTQYLAMIELGRKFPTPEKLEQLASALEIDAPELFSMPPSVKKAVKNIQRKILADLEQKVGESVNAAVMTALANVVTDCLKELDNGE